MKSAIEFRLEVLRVREEVIKTLFARREEVKELYVKQTGSEECPEGDIQLTQGFIHNYIDDQSNEVIGAISTERITSFNSFCCWYTATSLYSS